LNFQWISFQKYIFLQTYYLCRLWWLVDS